MICKISIKMDTPAFGETDESKGKELARILRYLARVNEISAWTGNEVSAWDANSEEVGLLIIEDV